MKKLFLMLMLIGVFFGQDSLNMSSLGEFDIPDTIWLPGSYCDIKIAGNNLLLTTGKKIHLATLSSPGSLSFIDTYTDTLGSFYKMSVFDSTFFCSSGNGIYGLKFSSNEISKTDFTSYYNNNYLSANDTLAILVDKNGLLTAFDITDQNQIDTISTYRFNLKAIQDCDMISNALYNLCLDDFDEDGYQIEIYDISLIDSISILDSVDLNEGKATDFIIADSLIFVAGFDTMLRIFQRFGTDSIVPLTSFGSDTLWKLGVFDTFLYGLKADEIHLFNFADIDSIFETGYYKTNELLTFYDLVSKDSLLYVYTYPADTVLEITTDFKPDTAEIRIFNFQP